MCIGEVHTIEGQSSGFRVVEIELSYSTDLGIAIEMLQIKQVLPLDVGDVRQVQPAIPV